MTKEEILRLFGEYDEVLLADGFEDAFLGVVLKFNRYSALYDHGRCVQILMERDGLSYGDALEYMEYNVVGAWVGEHTPVFLMQAEERGNPALRVLRGLVDTINATGGVVDMGELASYAPVADPDWCDLGSVYADACAVLNVEPVVRYE